MREPGLLPLCPLLPPPCGISMKGLHAPWSRLQGLGGVTQALRPRGSRGAQRFLTCSRLFSPTRQHLALEAEPWGVE